MKIILFALILSLAFIPALQSELLPDVEGLKSKGNSLGETNSKKVCGIELCSVIGMNAPTPPKGQIIIPENDDPEALTDPDDPVELLFVQTANSGTFIQKDGRNILTLVEVSPTTVWFSDRPHRITGQEATDLFAAKWAEGQNSFADNPPNAAIDVLDGTENSDVIIVELSNPVYSPESETLRYDVVVLEEATEGLTHYAKDADATIPPTFSKVSLFIDDADLDSVSTSNVLQIPGVSQFYGVDITKGISDDNLVPLALFDFDSDDTVEVQIGDSNYLVPESLVLDSTDDYQVVKHVYTSIKELSDSLSVSAGISYSSPTIDAEVDASYSQDSSTSESSYFATIDTYDRKYRLTAKTGLEATDRFNTAVANLPSEYVGNQNDYYDFFSTFGTHYTTFVDYGGIMHYWAQESDTSSTSTEEFETSVSATVGTMTGSVSGDVSTSGSHSESESTSNVNISIVGSGGNSSLLGAYLTERNNDSFNDWWASIDDNPGKINIKYNEIYNLVTDSKKKIQLQNALNDYVRSDFGSQIILLKSENKLTTTISIGTDSYDTDTVTYPDSSDTRTVKWLGKTVHLPAVVSKGGLMVVADQATGERVDTIKVSEDSGANSIKHIGDAIAKYEKKGNYLYFIGMFTEFTSADQSNFLPFQHIGASSFTSLNIGESNYYMLVGRTGLAEGYGQEKLLQATTSSAGGETFVDTNCEFSGSIAKTTTGFTAISAPSTSNCTVPSSQFVQSLDVWVTTSDKNYAGTDDTVTLTLGGLDFNLDNPHHDDFEKGNTDHFVLDTSDKNLDLFTITDVKIHKSKDGHNGGWHIHGVKIEADGVEIFNNQNHGKWLEDNDRDWGPYSVN